MPDEKWISQCEACLVTPETYAVKDAEGKVHNIAKAKFEALFTRADERVKSGKNKREE
jgi:hypothetical protein